MANESWTPVARVLETWTAAGQDVVTPPPGPLAPANTVLPAISGTPGVGLVLTCSTGTWDNAPTAYSYQWRLAGVAIPGAILSTYTPLNSHQLLAVSCAVTATNDAGSVTAVSAAVTIPQLAPVNTVTPQIAGTPEVGQTITVGTGTWDNFPTSFVRQWLFNDVVIPGATSANYTILTSQAGGAISATVTAINAAGSASATSTSVGIPVPPDIYTPSANFSDARNSQYLAVLWL